MEIETGEKNKMRKSVRKTHYPKSRSATKRKKENKIVNDVIQENFPDLKDIGYKIKRSH